MAKNETDQIVDACLRNIANTVAAQTGHSPRQILALFDLASFVDTASKVDPARLHAMPKAVQ